MKFSGLSIAAATWTVSAADRSSFNLRRDADDARRLNALVDDLTSMSMAADASRLASDGTGPPTKSGKQGGKSGKATMECPAGTRKLVKEKYRGKITGYQVCLRRVVSLFAPNRTPTNVALTLPSPESYILQWSVS